MLTYEEITEACLRHREVMGDPPPPAMLDTMEQLRDWVSKPARPVDYADNGTVAKYGTGPMTNTVVLCGAPPEPAGEWPAGDFRRTVLEDAALAPPEPDGEWHSLSPRGVVPRAVPVGGPPTSDDFDAEDHAETMMLVAGHKALAEIVGHSISSVALKAAYRAMAAHAPPVLLVSGSEVQAVRERDEALAKIEALRIDRNQQSGIRNHQRDEVAVLRTELTSSKSYVATLEDSLNRALHDLGTAMAEAHDMKRQIVAFSAANVSVKDEPKPMHDFTRLPRRDGRLMGNG